MMYFIEPLNEGQDLNYSERFGGSLEQAKERAKYMVVKLREILVQGTITVRIYNQDYEPIVEFK